jgi:hypothetical protein
VRPWERVALILAVAALAIVGGLVLVTWRDSDPDGAAWLNGRAVLATVLAVAAYIMLSMTRPPR